MPPIPTSRPLVGDAMKKIIAMSVGGGTMMTLASRAKKNSAPPGADGSSFMRRDRAEAMEYYSGLGKGVMIPTIGALLCVSMLYGWPRGKMLNSAGVASLSNDAMRSVQELGVSLAHSDHAELLTFISSHKMRALPRDVRREVTAAAMPPDKRELLLTQLTYGLGGGGLFGGLMAKPVIFGDDHYATRHFPVDGNHKVLPGHGFTPEPAATPKP